MLYRIFANLTLLPLLLALAACSNAASESELQNGSSSGPSLLGTAPADTLGQGVNSMSAEGKSICLENLVIEDDPEFFGPKPPDLRLIPSADALLKALAISATELEKTAANSRKAQLVNGLSFEPRYLHVLYSAKRIKEAKNLVGAQIKGQSEAGSAGLAAQYKTNYPSFLKSCGDSYISHVEKGDAYYAVITVVADAIESKDKLLNDLRATGWDPTRLVEMLKKYPVESIKALYVGETITSEAVMLTDLEGKIREIISMSKPVQNALVTIGVTPYRELSPSPDVRQAQRTAYVSAFEGLAAEQLKADQCGDRLNAIAYNSVEYAPHSLDIAKAKLAMEESVKAYGTALDNCEADSCSQGVCLIEQCAAETAEDEVSGGLAAVQSAMSLCKDSLPAMLPTDAQLYLAWKSAGGVNSPFGSMQELSTVQEGVIHQKFAHKALYKLGYWHLIGEMPRRVYDKWLSTPDLAIPTSFQGPQKYLGAVDVYEFAKGGSLYDVYPVDPKFSVYHIGAFRSYDWLQGEIPVSDELVQPTPPGQAEGFLDFRAQVKTLSNHMIVAGIKRAAGDTGSVPLYPRVRIPLDSALYQYYQDQGGLAWGVPLEGEGYRGVDSRYIVAPDGSGIWWNPYYGVSSLPAGLHKKYMDAGSANGSYGRVKGSYACQATCEVPTEGGGLVPDPVDWIDFELKPWLRDPLIFRPL